MTYNFQRSLDFVFRHECVFAPGHDGDPGYVLPENVSGDDGGLTKFGIDAADHPGLDVALLTSGQAAAIYRDGEWTHCLCDQLPEGIDTAVFDCAVNNGVPVAGILLQRALGSFEFPVAVDGEIGPATIWAAAAAHAKCGWPFTVRLLALRRQRYQDIALHNPALAKFLKGWLARVDDLERFLQSTI